MRMAEKRKKTSAKRRRAGGWARKPAKGASNPFRKLRGAGAQRVDVDRYLDAIRGR
jgi:hypothetical protein